MVVTAVKAYSIDRLWPLYQKKPHVIMIKTLLLVIFNLTQRGTQMFTDYALPENNSFDSSWFEEEKDIYYTYQYIKTAFWESREPDDENVLLSKALLNFKERRCKKEIKDYFMLEIARFISSCTPPRDYTRKRRSMTLISCPPSKRWSYSCIANAIQTIVKITTTSGLQTEQYLGLDPYVLYYDGSGILKRTTDTIPMKYLRNKPTISEVKDTITCFDTVPSVLSNEIILIDDITTTGTTLHACKEILIENGADPSRIHCYALARTRR